jgi:3-phenylpropionate/trans-cinnamate dioxygenase ferredoxin subunit
LTDDTYIYAADVASIAHGAVLAVRVVDRDILICHVKEDFFAVENQCSHARSKLENGRLRAHRLICPLHGAAFDVRDGSAKGKPATLPIRTYPVRVIDNRIEIKIE